MKIRKKDLKKMVRKEVSRQINKQPVLLSPGPHPLRSAAEVSADG